MTSKVLISPEYWKGMLYTVFDGIAYRAHGWFGCQLQSIERKKPRIGDTRILRTDRYYYEFKIFSVERIGLFTYECNWALPMDCGYEEYSGRVHKMLTDIFSKP